MTCGDILETVIRTYCCARSIGHSGFHRDGLRTWGPTPVRQPEWVRRAQEQRRTFGYIAVKEVAA